MEKYLAPFYPTWSRERFAELLRSYGIAPTSGLDPLAREERIDTLAEFMENPAPTVQFSTHITSDPEQIADRVTVLDNGRVLASEPTTDLLDSFRLVKGGPADLTDPLRRGLYGLRETAVGFEGIARTDEADTWPGDLVLDPPTLDRIVAAVAKGKPEVAGTVDQTPTATTQEVP